LKISNAADKEVFSIREFGFEFDIESLIYDINHNKVEHEVLDLEIDHLLTFVRSDMPDMNAIENMSESRKSEPIIATIIDEKNRVIDGNHRLIKCNNDGLKSCKVIFVSPHLLEAYLINA